ncbi:MAG: hypothetical protein ABH950_06925 [Candidatus Altiarchaeota archaeon]
MPGEVGRPRKIDKMSASITVRLQNKELENFKKLCQVAKRKPADIIREFIRGKITENRPELISRFSADDAIQPIVGAITYRYNQKTEKIESHGVTDEGDDILLEVHEPEHIEEDISHMYEAYQKYISSQKPHDRRMPRKIHRI